LEALKEKSFAMSHAQQLGASLIESTPGDSVVDFGIQKEINELNNKWKALDKHV